jgi:carbon storage regulator
MSFEAGTMLVVTRKIGEQVQIGHDILVTVVRIADGTVRIGVDAPANTAVVRRELLREGNEPRRDATAGPQSSR